MSPERILVVAISLALLPSVAPALEFTDWTSVDVDQNVAKGSIGGCEITLSGSNIYEGTVDGTWDFSSDFFSPATLGTDQIALTGHQQVHSYEIVFGCSVKDPVFHLQSVASLITFSTPGVTLVKLNGEPSLRVSGAQVAGRIDDGSVSARDANGSVRVIGVYDRLSMTIRYEPPSGNVSPEDGIRIQVGGEVVVETCTCAEGEYSSERETCVLRLCEVPGMGDGDKGDAYFALGGQLYREIGGAQCPE